MAEVTYSPSDFRKLSRSVGRHQQKLKTLTRKMQQIDNEIQEVQSEIRQMNRSSNGWDEQNSHGAHIFGSMLAGVKEKVEEGKRKINKLTKTKKDVAREIEFLNFKLQKANEELAIMRAEFDESEEPEEPEAMQN